MYKYILRANGMKALDIHSDMLWEEITEYVRVHSKPIHKDSHDRVFSWGTIDFVNPQVMLPSEFADHCPAMIGIV